MEYRIGSASKKWYRYTPNNNDSIENGGLDIGIGLTLGKVDKFCYLGDMLNADGGVDSVMLQGSDKYGRSSKRCRLF
ncbi:unnamed protein product [Gordionus sp. m RMFG-2023]